MLEKIYDALKLSTVADVPVTLTSEQAAILLDFFRRFSALDDELQFTKAQMEFTNADN